MSGAYCKTQVKRKLKVAVTSSARTTEITTVINCFSTALEQQLLQRGKTVLWVLVMLSLKVLLRHLHDTGKSGEAQKNFRIRDVEDLLISVSKMMRIPSEVKMKVILYTLRNWRSSKRIRTARSPEGRGRGGFPEGEREVW